MQLKERLIRAKQKIFDKAYNFLNDKQREAVFSTEGPLLVLAGAGSGKTTVLVHRIAYIVSHGNAYYNTDVPENMLIEPFVERLEEIAAEENTDKDTLESAMESFAFNPAMPYQILAITFTNKAASEIKERLEKALGERAFDIWAGTFHSVCAKILRMYADRLGYSRTFTIYDTDDQKRLMTAIIKEFNLNDKTFAPKSVLNQISRAKENLMFPDDYAATVSEHDLRKKTLLKLYKEYEARKKSANALDFDDLILLTVKLLESDEEVLEKFRKKFKYILVDEYQDTNKAQFVLTKMLCNDDNNIMVVGDDDQSIYKFRGATIDNILGFDRFFENTKIVKLEQNYRSSGVIVRAANSVIKNNKGRKGKTLWTGNSDGEKITVRLCENQNSESQYVVNTITDLVSAGEYKFEDFAVLYRMNSQSLSLETSFAKSAIPYRIIGGMRFYERKEIKDIIAYLCVIANPGDSLRLKRIINVPKRGIGDATVEELERISLSEGKDMLYCAENADCYPALVRASSKLKQFASMMNEIKDGYEKSGLGVLCEKVLEKTGYLEALSALDEAESKDRTANVKELVSNATEYENNHPGATLENFLEEVALVSDIDNYDKDASAVVMMTVHSAKGLEFPVVFLPGLEEGIFPGNQTICEAEEEMEEERRLAYVAITRAKKRLYIVHCRNRLVFGKFEYHNKSRFAEEIPEELCVFEGSDMDFEYTRDEYAKGNMVGASKKIPVWDSAKNSAFAYSAAHKAMQNKAKTAPKAECFGVGARVKHHVFGSGTVLSAKQMSGDVLYEVAFDNGGTKKLMGNFAKMTAENS